MRRLAAALLAVVALPAFAAGDELGQLRAQYAMRFLDPAAHLTLAKHLLERGDRLTAFFVSEAARRSYFGDEDFDAAFRRVFRNDDFDNSAAAETKAAASVAASPDDPKKHLKLADIFLSRGEWKKAEPEIRAAIALAPDDYSSTAVLAEVLRQDGRKDDAAKVEAAWLEAHPAAVETLLRRAESLLSSKSPDAAAAIAAALEKFPNDARLHFARARLLQTSDVAGATKEYLEAARLDPQSALIQGWTARFLLKTAKDEEKALQGYLDAYFLDPHFYDSEYAESRIRELAWKGGQARYAAQRANGVTPKALLADPDPVVAGAALQEAGRKWNDAYVAPLVALLAGDDPNNRYAAASLLGRHLQANDERLTRLLADDDLRVRGAAAYIAGAAKRKGLAALMVSWLESPSELIQYDAASVLLLHGGDEGKATLQKLLAAGKIKHPRLRAIAERSLAAPPGMPEIR